MPPAGSGRPLHPCRLTLTAFGSHSEGKSFQQEAEGYPLVGASQLRWNSMFHVPKQ
ncbi:MAG: hypothetical protein LBQ54_07875 [Planctomycetaceae bacterium]|nr:hypothetical protein [Planctomycetaceae bacterium]